MSRRIFLIVLLAMLALPAALGPLGVDMESRQAATAGDETPLAFRVALATWRDELLALAGESGDEQVVRGKGLLFYQDEMPDYLGWSAMSEAELAAVADRLAALRDALADEGRELVALLAPNKSSVYPEAVPDRYLPGSEASNLVRLQEALDARGVAYIDALALLTEAKPQGPLYFALDTHWNARGAGVVYRALADKLTLADRYEDAAFLPGQAGDLIVLARPGAAREEPDAVPDIPRTYRTVRPMRSLDDLRIETICEAVSPSMLMVRDSFGAGLFPYLANAVGHLTCSRLYEDVAGQASQAGADVVVLEIVERNIPLLGGYAL